LIQLGCIRIQRQGLTHRAWNYLGIPARPREASNSSQANLTLRDPAQKTVDCHGLW